MSKMIDRARIAVAEILQQSNLPVGSHLDSEKIVLAVLGEVQIEAGACAKTLRAEHFAQPHTDMAGDEEERRGYLKGIAALADAMKRCLKTS